MAICFSLCVKSIAKLKKFNNQVPPKKNSFVLFFFTNFHIFFHYLVEFHVPLYARAHVHDPSQEFVGTLPSTELPQLVNSRVFGRPHSSSLCMLNFLFHG